MASLDFLGKEEKVGIGEGYRVEKMEKDRWLGGRVARFPGRLWVVGRVRFIPLNLIEPGFWSSSCIFRLDLEGFDKVAQFPVQLKVPDSLLED